MIKVYDVGKSYTIVNGDCREVMRSINDGVIDCCVTSPPYFNLREYDGEVEGSIGSQDNIEEYIRSLVSVFSEVKRILKDDGTLWLNIGDSFSRKTHGSIRQKERIGIPWMLAFALREDGWMIRQDIVWEKPNVMPESVKDRFTCSHEMVFMMVKNGKYMFNSSEIKEPSAGNYKIGAETPRFGGTKYGDSDDKHHSGKSGKRWVPSMAVMEDGSKVVVRNMRDVWKISVQPFSGCHFVTFPEHLVDRCIRCGCRDGGVVIDPFSGSGTTGLSAMKNGRKFIGIDTSEKYCAISSERIRNFLCQC